jgi:hypothetical protein
MAVNLLAAVCDPSFETDSNSDGLANGWEGSGNMLGPPSWVASLPAGLFGAKAQRAYLASAATQTNKNAGFLSGLSAVGTITAGSAYSLGYWVKAALVGCSGYAVIYWYKADGTYIGTSTGSPTYGSEWAWVTVQNKTAPALASRFRVYLAAQGIDTGDTLDFTADGAKLEKSATATPFLPPPNYALMGG